MQVTTALRKIAALRKRIKGIQGGQGAGKTYAILALIINHASSNANKEIFIASEELSKMRITVIKDFINIMKSFNIYNSDHFTDGTLYRFPNGSFIKFIGLDKVDIGKGLRSDIMFVNEANKVKFDTYRELTSRAKQIFIDFNPNRKFWFHTEILTRNDCDFLKLTFLDNEFLSKEERGEILRYKEKGFAKDGTVINQYWANMWRVYGLGEVGQVEG
jgi:PBSX family phage terminase large subunit